MLCKSNFLVVCLVACGTFSFCYDVDDLENAVRASDVELVRQIVHNEEIHDADSVVLLDLADEVIEQKKEAIFSRKLRVYASMGFKTVGVWTGPVGPIIGCCLDQRGLGVVLGLLSLNAGGMASLMMMVGGYEVGHLPLGIVGALLGLAATGGIVAGLVKLECWLWKRERRSHDKLENEYQDALKIRAFLKRKMTARH